MDLMYSLIFQLNSWMNVSNVAYTTVNHIITEVFESYEKGANFTRKKIETLLRSEGMKKETIDKLLK